MSLVRKISILYLYLKYEKYRCNNQSDARKISLLVSENHFIGIAIIATIKKQDMLQ